MLNELIYDYFEKTDSNRKAKEFDSEALLYFNPSSFSACKRQIFYKKRNVAPSNPITAASYLKMQFGTVLHTSIQNIIKNLGILIEAERLKVKEFDGLHFRYKVDGIIILKKQRHIVEIKTVSSGGLRVVRDEPKPSDVVQMVLYMIFEQIPHGILLYVGRDSAFMEEYVVTKGDHLYLAAIAEIERKMLELKQLETQIKTGVMPRRDCQIALKNKDGIISEKFQRKTEKIKSDWQCEYCAYKSTCWSSEFEEIKTHKFYIGGEFIG